MKAAWLVYRKDLMDALRDRRTLLMVLLSSVVLGPVLLMALSTLVGQMERRAEQREVMVAGLEHAPTLENYLQRQTFTVKRAPAGYEQQLRDSKLGDPVVVVPPDFEAALQRGEAPLLEVVSSSANQRSQGGAGRVRRLLQGFMSEQATLRLASRGVSSQVAEVLQVESRDLANPQTRAAQLTGMLPFFVLMAVLYGAVNAALDTTAGERERGSLEPLLMNPTPPWAIVLGKWGAVASVSILIAVLSCLSFLPGQWVLRSDTLAALFQYGLREAALFMLVLLPFAAAFSALLMAVAIRCRSFKEAQASATVVMLAASLVPLVGMLSLDGEAPWHLWVPAFAQNTLMARVLKGESLGASQVMVPLAVCIVLTVACIVFVARRLRSAAVR